MAVHHDHRSQLLRESQCRGQPLLAYGRKGAIRHGVKGGAKLTIHHGSSAQLSSGLRRRGRRDFLFPNVFMHYGYNKHTSKSTGANKLASLVQPRLSHSTASSSAHLCMYRYWGRLTWSKSICSISSDSSFDTPFTLAVWPLFANTFFFPM